MKIFVPEDVLRLPPAETLERITALLTEAGPDDDTWYAQWWAADALTLMGRYREAVMMYPSPSFDRAPFQTERLLSLKVTAALPYTAADALALLGPRITAYGRELIRPWFDGGYAVTQERTTLNTSCLPRNIYQKYVNELPGWLSR
ncbi:hypothetical protein, partial [Brevibacterium sp. FAM 24630]|uniref:hypothetical protein n=1 Tax=Brevibacterium sp. FAM 24630 TaxID=3415680 RepID=UPI003C7D902A